MHLFSPSGSETDTDRTGHEGTADVELMKANSLKIPKIRNKKHKM